MTSKVMSYILADQINKTKKRSCKLPRKVLRYGFLNFRHLIFENRGGVHFWQGSVVQQLAKILLLPLEYGFQYYWEIHYVYLNSKNNQFIGRDCVWQTPQDQPVKRRSEVRAPMPRFTCMGSITLTMDIWHYNKSCVALSRNNFGSAFSDWTAVGLRQIRLDDWTNENLSSHKWSQNDSHRLMRREKEHVLTRLFIGHYVSGSN